MNADWFYSVGDTRQGPVTENELKGLVADGRLRPADLVWRDGMADWVEARTVPAFFPSPKVEPLPDDGRPSRRRDDDYDRPSRRARHRDDDEADDDRPRVRRRNDDGDRYDDGYDRPKKRPKPGQIQAVAIMMLVGGILGLINALVIALATICLWPGIYYEIVVCILMIIRAANMLGPDDRGPPRTLAILQIICIANGDVINCVLGIVSIIMLHDPHVEEYYRRRGF